MKALNSKLLKRFLKLASEQLAGDWVLLGGTVLPLLGHDRSTTDIDFVPVDNTTTEQQLKVMGICRELGLPIEAANSAAQFFLHKIKDFKKHLVLLIEGPNAKIFRPNVFLYLQLKCNRMTEVDLSDCLAMLRLKAGELEDSQRKPLIRVVNHHQKSASPEKIERFVKLLDVLKSI